MDSLKTLLLCLVCSEEVNLIASIKNWQAKYKMCNNSLFSIIDDKTKNDFVGVISLTLQCGKNILKIVFQTWEKCCHSSTWIFYNLPHTHTHTHTYKYTHMYRDIRSVCVWTYIYIFDVFIYIYIYNLLYKDKKEKNNFRGIIINLFQTLINSYKFNLKAFFYKEKKNFFSWDILNFN